MWSESVLAVSGVFSPVSQCAVPLRSAGGRGSLVVLSQCRSFGVLLRLCERLVVLDDPLDHGATALLYPLQIDHVGRHTRQLMRHADLTCGEGGRLRLPKTSAQYCYWAVGGATHQLLVADGEVRHLSPAHRHRVKAAVRFPAEDPQRVRGAAVQAGAIWAKTYTPETTGTGVRGHIPVTPCCNGEKLTWPESCRPPTSRSS